MVSGLVDREVRRDVEQESVVLRDDGTEASEHLAAREVEYERLGEVVLGLIDEAVMMRGLAVRQVALQMLRRSHDLEVGVRRNTFGDIATRRALGGNGHTPWAEDRGEAACHRTDDASDPPQGVRDLRLYATERDRNLRHLTRRGSELRADIVPPDPGIGVFQFRSCGRAVA
jgi:hypothetical protein